MHRVLLFIALLSAHAGIAQSPEQFIRSHVDILTSPAMHGRGYLQDGRALAAALIQRKFVESHLTPAGVDGTYIQGYAFPVNTFPAAMHLVINGKELIAGADYHINASSVSMAQENMSVHQLDFAGVKNQKKLRKKLRKLRHGQAWVLTHVDSMCRSLKIRTEQFAATLPAGCYIIPQTAKLTWTVSSDTIAATVFYVKPDALPPDITTVSVNAASLFIPHSHNENIIGTLSGEVKDTFIAVTAHYDHLGMMGDSAFFPGASDNASGTSMMLYLASWFAAHPPHYSMLFIAFSGEEAGLLGSQYYSTHPTIPLSNIKFLTNIDIMGDATDGVTVVNATEFPKQFTLLQNLNDRSKYLPAIKSRGKAANSDHYYFTNAGVPSFFIYSNGGKGYYHDVYDTGSALTLNHIGEMAHLMIDFINGLR